MKPYNFINHIIEDILSSYLKDNYSLLYFPNNIRFDHSIPEHTDYLVDKAETGTNFIPPGGRPTEENSDWIQRFEQGEDLSTDVWHANKWIRTDSISPRFFPYITLRNKEWVKCNFIQHSWEPVYYTLDSRLWDHYASRKSTAIVLHSEHASKDIEKLHSMGIPNVHWFAHAYLCSEFYFKHYQKLKMVTEYKARPIRYPWICTNRLIDGARKYRLDFLNCIDTSKGMYSLLDKDPYTNRKLEEIYPSNKVLPHSFDDHENHSAEIKVDELTPWNTSFLHVVSETIWQDKIHFTEKVFKPVVLHQPFVVLQAPNSLMYLRSYGFKTFGAWWDESYDTIEDPQERMQAIADIVNSIGNKSLEELERMRTEMASVLEHNFRHFYENIPAICLNELSVGITLTP